MKKYNAEWWGLNLDLQDVEEIAVSITRDYKKLIKEACILMTKTDAYTNANAAYHVKYYMHHVLTNYRTFGACSDASVKTLITELKRKFGYSTR